MFGSGNTQAQTQTVASGVSIQSSCYGGVVPVIYGQTRLTGNLIWYGDFQAIPVESSGGNGGKGGDGGHGSTTYDYKASFIFALGEGTLGGVQNVWASKKKQTLSASGLSFADGHLGQPDWGTLDTNHADQALGYSGTGYVYVAAYDLGQSAQLPNLSYEVTGLLSGVYSGSVDADPAAVIADILTNARYGVGFPSARISYLGFVNFSNWCQANGLVISPVFDTQSDAANQLNTIVQSCNAEFVWTGTGLTIVPYGDEDVSGNGKSYTAPSVALFSLTDDDFLDQGGQDPVQCSRARPSDQMNAVRFEFLDRAHAYNANIVEAKNQAAIEAYGLRGEQPEQMHHFCDANAAKLAATLKLQRQSVRNVYSFTLGWRYCLLDPMDIVEITDANLGLNQQWVRILSLEEDDNGNIKVTAEEYLGGSGGAPLYDFEPGSPYDVDYNIDPGSVTASLIFEPPPAMLAARSKDAPQIMIAACGGANWGGCEVHVSLDNATYKRIGRITSPGRLGTLSANLASSSDPDTTHTLAVDLRVSGGRLLPGTTTTPHADADAFRTLCYVDGELIAYDSATLTGTNQYNLTYLRRGVFGSAVAAHAGGANFCRLDETAKSFDLPVTPVSYVGTRIYVKLVSYNIFGGALQDISTVAAIPYNPNGAGVFVAPPSGVGFSVGAEQQGDGTWISYGVVSWTASPDPFFDMYDVQYRLHVGPGPWQSRRVGSDTTSIRISPLAPNTAYDVQVRAVRTKGPFYSAWSQKLNIASAVKTAPPAAPTNLSVIGGSRQMFISWKASIDPVTNNPENDIAYYEVWQHTSTAATPPMPGSTLIGMVNGTKFIDTHLGLSDTLFYWIRAVDTSGNPSTTYLGPGSATTFGVDPADFTRKVIGTDIDNATIAGVNLANNIIDLSKLAGGYGMPYTWTGGSLPGPADARTYNGSIIFWTHDGRLYRYNATLSTPAWVLAVDGTDLSAGSILANTLGVGSVTAAAIAAGAVTAEKLFIGDTTNLVLDDMFQDSAYWTLRNPGTSPTIIVQYQSATVPPAGANGTNNLGALTSVQVATANIPAASTLNYGATSAFIPIKQNLSYRASCSAACSGTGVNKNAQLFINWFDAQQNFLSSSAADGPSGPAGSGQYAPTDDGEDGNGFTSTNGSTIVNTAAAPAGACYAQVIPCVPGGGASAPAGTGSGWWFSHVRLERQAVGTLIKDGEIDTDHIVTGGLDAGVITAGTITGDRFTSNLAFSSIFTAVSGSGSGSVQMNGTHATIGSHVDGPYFVARDDANTVRFVAGRLQDNWGMWLYDASGNPFFEEYQLASGVVVTDHISGGAVSGAATASIASGSFGPGAGNWTQIASTSFTLYDTAKTFVAATVLLGYSSGPQNWGVRLKVDGVVKQTIATGVANTEVSVTVSWSGSLSGSGGGIGHSFAVEWYGDSTMQLDGGSLTALGLQR